LDPRPDHQKIEPRPDQSDRTFVRRRPRSGAAPGRALRAVFEEDAGVLELIAEAVGLGPLASLAGGGAAFDQLVDGRVVEGGGSRIGEAFAAQIGLWVALEDPQHVAEAAQLGAERGRPASSSARTRLISRTRSKRTARASGVAKSSSIAAWKRSLKASPPAGSAGGRPRSAV
jgi:hypothetical protein